MSRPSALQIASSRWSLFICVCPCTASCVMPAAISLSSTRVFFFRSRKVWPMSRSPKKDRNASLRSRKDPYSNARSERRSGVHLEHAHLTRHAARSDDVEVIEPLRDVLVLRFLGLQLDGEAQVVDAVGVPERVLVADLARLVQVEQRLVESLHAELARLLHDLLDLVHLALEDEVGNERRVEHDLDRGTAALALLQRNQAHRDHAAQVQRQVHEQLLAPLLGEEVDDAVKRLVGAVRVKRREAQVAGLGKSDGVLHRLALADLADEDGYIRSVPRW